MQSRHYKIQTPTMNNLLSGRKHRISPPSCTSYFSACSVKQRIVEVQRYCSGRIEHIDKQVCQHFPQLSGQPAGFWKDSVIRVVSSFALWVCEWKNAGDSSSGGTEYPSGYQFDENRCCWLSEDRIKVQDNRIPCRCENRSIHFGLHEKVLYLSLSSAGHFYFYSFS